MDPSANMVTIKQIWAETDREADVLVLPGLGITSIPINSSNPNWYTATHWAELQNFTEKNGLLLLVTTVLEHITVPPYIRHSLLLVQPGKIPQLKGQIHDSLLSPGTGIEPVVLDLPNARAGILIGHDALFPEITTHLAKSGIDILLIASEVGTTESSHNVNAPNYFWEVDALYHLWKTQTDHVFHLAASDWTGNGVVIENSFGVIGRLETVDAISPVKILDLDSNFVRTKFLNAYYDFDLETLVGTNQLYQSKPDSKSAVDMIQIH
jgi:predicted amidohydrolase